MSSLRTSLVLAASLALVAGCRGQTSTEPPIVPLRGMHEMPRYDAQERGRYFEDGRSMRPEIEGTVARESEIDEQVATGLDVDGSYVLSLPTSVVERAGGVGPLLQRGHQRYDIYCAPCHGALGDGQGMVSQRATSLGVTFAAANLMDPGFQHMPDGRLYATIANGVRTMPAYRAQIPVQDRWAIVGYVRALQISQGDAAAATADTDRDQLPAGADGCPEQAEDRDGFDDLDGCPDLDNDEDGIADAVDACPLSPGPAAAPAPAPVDGAAEAAVVATAPSMSGCAGSVSFDSGGSTLRLGGAIRFENGRDTFKRSSLAPLDELRAFLTAHPEIARVSIEGHTASNGDEAVNRALSERRARATMQWLVEHGVDASRLTAVGFGSSRPRASNDTAEGRQANRRVEARIVTPVVDAAAVPGAPGGV